MLVYERVDQNPMGFLWIFPIEKSLKTMEALEADHNDVVASMNSIILSCLGWMARWKLDSNIQPSPGAKELAR